MVSLVRSQPMEGVDHAVIADNATMADEVHSTWRTVTSTWSSLVQTASQPMEMSPTRLVQLTPLPLPLLAMQMVKMSSNAFYVARHPQMPQQMKRLGLEVTPIFYGKNGNHFQTTLKLLNISPNTLPVVYLKTSPSKRRSADEVHTYY